MLSLSSLSLSMSLFLVNSDIGWIFAIWTMDSQSATNKRNNSWGLISLIGVVGNCIIYHSSSLPPNPKQSTPICLEEPSEVPNEEALVPIKQTSKKGNTASSTTASTLAVKKAIGKAKASSTALVRTKDTKAKTKDQGGPKRAAAQKRWLPCRICLKTPED